MSPRNLTAERIAGVAARPVADTGRPQAIGLAFRASITSQARGDPPDDTVEFAPDAASLVADRDLGQGAQLGAVAAEPVQQGNGGGDTGPDGPGGGGAGQPAVVLAAGALEQEQCA